VTPKRGAVIRSLLTRVNSGRSEWRTSQKAWTWEDDYPVVMAVVKLLLPLAQDNVGRTSPVLGHATVLPVGYLPKTPGSGRATSEGRCAFLPPSIHALNSRHGAPQAATAATRILPARKFTLKFQHLSHGTLAPSNGQTGHC
jgi:hypothetical protein